MGDTGMSANACEFDASGSKEARGEVLVSEGGGGEQCVTAQQHGLPSHEDSLEAPEATHRDKRQRIVVSCSPRMA